MPKSNSTLGSGSQAPVVRVNRRNVGPGIQLQLVAAAGGRCEFHGCNVFLFLHPLTKDAGNFGQMAHIVAFREGGPRGADQRPEDINSIDNLMLLCPQCHKLIDDKPEEYTVQTLRNYKDEHERRIHDVTEAGPDLRTEVIQLRGLIGGQIVDIPAPHIREAIRPRYVASKHGCIIDVVACLAKEDANAFLNARAKIRKDLKTCFDGGLDGRQIRHFSIFALAPIPVLMAFGREIGDKVGTDLFQRHRDTQSWAWKEVGTPVEYSFNMVQQGRDPKAVAVLLSLSGKVLKSSLPELINTDFTVYELTLEGQEPSREFLRLREDLARFRRVYQGALAAICRQHPGIRTIHAFPAIPAPIAIACGQELMPKAHPEIIVYDLMKTEFQRSLTINSPEEL